MALQNRTLRVAVAGVMLCMASAASIAAAATTYRFTPLIALDALEVPSGLTVPVLAKDGQAASSGQLKGQKDAVFKVKTGGEATVIATDDQFRSFGDLSINDKGQVAFEAYAEDVSGDGIYRGEGGRVTKIVGTGEAGDFDWVNAGPSINSHGRVAFIGERLVNRRYVGGVYVGDGGAVKAVYDIDGQFKSFTGNPALNDKGTVAFLATLETGVGGLFLGNGRDQPVTVADDTGLLTSVYSFSDPSINDHGEVAFRAGTNPDLTDNSLSTGAGIFLYRRGVLSTVISGPMAFSVPAINQSGQVAFVAEPTVGNTILATGGDLVNDRVIGSGDQLLGHVVKTIEFSRQGYNERGQLVFLAHFDDGSSAVFLARPVSHVAGAD